MYRTAVIETGRTPDEVDTLSMKELSWLIEGARIRDANVQYGSRQIWVSIHNALSKAPYRTHEAVARAWPLYTDGIAAQPIDENELIKRFKALKEAVRLKT